MLANHTHPHLGSSSLTIFLTKERKSLQKFMQTVGFQQLYSPYKRENICIWNICRNKNTSWQTRIHEYGCMLISKCPENDPLRQTLISWDIWDVLNVSMCTTCPSLSLNPATMLGTPGRKDCAHHFSSLYLEAVENQYQTWWTSKYQSEQFTLQRCLQIFTSEQDECSDLWKLLRCLGVWISAEVLSSK